MSKSPKQSALNIERQDDLDEGKESRAQILKIFETNHEADFEREKQLQAFQILKEVEEKRTLDRAQLRDLVGIANKHEVDEICEASPRVYAEYVKSSEEMAKALLAFETRITKQCKYKMPENIEQQRKLFLALEIRFAEPPKHYKRLKRPRNIDFAEVKATLEANPTLIYSLARMEETGGCPDIIEVRKDFFTFADCCATIPEGRRNLYYHEAVVAAKEFGVNMISWEAYDKMQQELGRFDSDNWCWIDSLESLKKDRTLLVGHDYYDFPWAWLPFPIPIICYKKLPDLGWRGMLKVPRVPSQKLALAILKEANEKGTLNPSVKKGLEELIGAEKGLK